MRKRDTLRKQLSEKILGIDELKSHRIAFLDKFESVEKERNAYLDKWDKAKCRIVELGKESGQVQDGFKRMSRGTEKLNHSLSLGKF